jgi:hypothetical protein
VQPEKRETRTLLKIINYFNRDQACYMREREFELNSENSWKFIAEKKSEGICV